MLYKALSDLGEAVTEPHVPNCLQSGCSSPFKGSKGCDRLDRGERCVIRCFRETGDGCSRLKLIR
jgi:hypothetical protein